MGTLIDNKQAKLIELGFSGSVPDMEKEFYISEGAEPGSFNDVVFSWLASKGFDQGTIQDRWMAYLDSLGYTGSLTDRLILFWEEYVQGVGSFKILLENDDFLMTEDNNNLRK